MQYYRDRKEDSSRSRHSDSRKYDEKKPKEGRGTSGTEKHRRYEEEKRDRADKTLQDLRERLLSKRTSKGEEELQRLEKGRRERRRRSTGKWRRWTALCRARRGCTSKKSST
jgi:hypothetical protein